jgi:hypothetical protein
MGVKENCAICSRRIFEVVLQLFAIERNNVYNTQNNNLYSIYTLGLLSLQRTGGGGSGLDNWVGSRRSAYPQIYLNHLPFFYLIGVFLP